MQIRLVENWRDILLKAWSVRLILLAGLFSGLQAALGVIPIELIQLLPVWVWPVVTLVITAGALVSRLILQESLQK